MIQIFFHGTRGSFPTSSPNHFKYGGHTSCISIIMSNKWIILDAGTGIIDAGQIAKMYNFRSCHLLLSHMHLDHIVGLPSFTPLWDPDFSINIYSQTKQTNQHLNKLISPPYFPVEWEAIPAVKNFSSFRIGESLMSDRSYRIDTIQLSHPGGSCGYKISCNGYQICYITDTDMPENLKLKLINFVRNCDLLIFDSTYCDSEYGPVSDFGHSTWQIACDIALQAKVKKLALFHHAPDHTDDFIDKIEKEAKIAFPKSFAARCGQILTLPE